MPSLNGDYFSFLGLPRKLQIDQAQLDERFRALSRQFHPDFHYNAAPAERRASLERSSYLNDAYRTLKEPASRIEYLLKLELPGEAAANGDARRNSVPRALLEEVFALNEQLADVRELRSSGAPAGQWREELGRARQPIEAKRLEHERQLQTLSVEWDALVERGADGSKRQELLAALEQCMLESNYLANLLAGLERELGNG